jgi:deoxyribose-phosphate aldolase
MSTTSSASPRTEADDVRTVREAPTVDAVMLEQRASGFKTRSIKTASKVAGLKLALAMTDLTTLEGKDSPEKVRSLCRRAIRPMPDDERVLGERLPSVAAVCVYPRMVEVARECVAETGIKVASVATGFPSGQSSLAVRLREVEEAVSAGADEIDMVISRGAFLAGRYAEVAREIRETASACGSAHLKVILETGELVTYDHVRRASDLAIANIRDGDFIKTSTGKVSPAATMPVTLCMLQAIADEFVRTGRKIGMKPAGGIRTSKDALHYLVMVSETLGPLTPGEASPWMTPDLFRFGASSLVDDLIRQLRRMATGVYAAGYDLAGS